MNKQINQISGLFQESREPITKIKAISLHQPYASLIAMGLKKFETRSWSTNYRGKLVICAAKKNTLQQQSNYETLANSLLLDLTVHPWSSLPKGMAIAVCDLTDCIQMTESFISEQSEQEQLCGHWESGRFAWKLENVQPFPQPVPIKGKQGLWKIPPDEFERLCGDGFSTSTIIPEVVNNQALTDTEELTYEEERDRLHLERKVERAFYEAGKALQELRERRLYRNTHKTFESYCQERFGHSRQKANFLIAGAKAYENLTTNCCQTDPENLTTNGTQTETETQMTTNGCQNQDELPTSLTTNGTQNPKVEMTTNGRQTEMAKMTTNGRQILPTSEGQVRPLTKLEPDQQREAWALAVEQAGGKVPSGRIVKSIVSQIRERNPIPNPWRKGEVAMIIVKDNPDLRGKGGCWCVITEVHNFSCTVRLWDGNYQVKPENLKDLPYSNEQEEEVRKLCDRLSSLYSPEMEDTAKAVLASLGRIDRPWLTDIEESLLALLEEKMKQ